jgi:RNase P/RNase MRP subunit POP5
MSHTPAFATVVVSPALFCCYELKTKTKNNSRGLPLDLERLVLSLLLLTNCCYVLGDHLLVAQVVVIVIIVIDGGGWLGAVNITCSEGIFTMRIKFRYLIFQAFLEGSGASEFSQKEVSLTVREKVQQLFGDVGAGSFGGSAQMKFFDNYSKIFVLRVPRDHEMNVRMALCTVTELRKSPVIIRLLSVAGCTRTALDRLEHVFRQVAEHASTPEEKSSLAVNYSALLRKTAL